MNISAIVKSIRNIMRKDEGVDGDAQRISQMVWMLFMKIFADKEDEWKSKRKNYKSPIPEVMKWQNWAADENGLTGDSLIKFVNEELFPTLKAIHPTDTDQSVIIKSVFNDTYNYMKSGNLFRQVVNEINKINFSSGNADIHIFNEIYETILKELQSAGSSGEFYTPRAVTKFMVEMINPQIGDSILDPACGTGGFLTCSIDHLSSQRDFEIGSYKIQETIRGVEKKPLPHLLCTTNLILHGIEKPAVSRGNLLAKSFDSWNSKNQVDIVLSNPPFGGQEENGTEKNFPTIFQTKETADLFLILIIQLLKKGGKAAVVLPDASLYGNGIKTNIRQELLTKCNLHTIVRLPNGVFNPYTSIKTNLLFFDKGKPTKKIWYYNLSMPYNVKSFNKNRTILSEDFKDLKDWWNNRIENEFAWQVDIASIASANYVLDNQNPRNVQTENTELVEDLIKTIEDSFQRSQILINQLKEAFK